MDCRDDCPNTIGGVFVDPSGCPPQVPGDLDRDGDVDQRDLTMFTACADQSGPAVPLQAGCEYADLDPDNDIDQVDFSILQRCYSGQDIPADPDCR